MTSSPETVPTIPLHPISLSDMWCASFSLASGAIWDTPAYSWDGGKLIFHLKTGLTAEEVISAYRTNQVIGGRSLAEAYQECKRVLAEAKAQREAT